MVWQTGGADSHLVEHGQSEVLIGHQAWYLVLRSLQ